MKRAAMLLALFLAGCGAPPQSVLYCMDTTDGQVCTVYNTDPQPRVMSWKTSVTCADGVHRVRVNALVPAKQQAVRKISCNQLVK